MKIVSGEEEVGEVGKFLEFCFSMRFLAAAYLQLFSRSLSLVAS
jgi:hypothetical protein